MSEDAHATSPPLRVLGSPAFKARKINPYTASLYDRLLAMGVDVAEFSPAGLRAKPSPDIWHLHWPEGILKHPSAAKASYLLARFRQRLVCAKKHGVRIVWTVHNLGPHEKNHPRLEALFWRMFLPRLDGCIHLSHAGRALALARFPRLAALPAPAVPPIHPRGLYADTVNKKDARRRLGLPMEARVVLFLGQIRPYKNVPTLIAAFARIKDPAARLIIAGWPRDQRLRDAIQAQAARDMRIHTELAFIPEEKIQVYLRAADLMVAPYRDILNSATALLALAFDCPVLAPAKGALGELQARVGSRWVLLYSGDLTPEDLDTALDQCDLNPSAKPDLTDYDSARVAAATLAAYRSVKNPSAADLSVMQSG